VSEFNEEVGIGDEEENDKPESEPEKSKTEREMLRAIAGEGFVNNNEDEDGKGDLRS